MGWKVCLRKIIIYRLSKVITIFYCTKPLFLPRKRHSIWLWTITYILWLKVIFGLFKVCRILILLKIIKRKTKIAIYFCMSMSQKAFQFQNSLQTNWRQLSIYWKPIVISFIANIFLVTNLKHMCKNISHFSLSYNDLMNTAQVGFRKGCSTTSALLSLVRMITDAFEYRGSVMWPELIWPEAFYVASYDILVAKIQILYMELAELCYNELWAVWWIGDSWSH